MNRKVLAAKVAITLESCHAVDVLGEAFTHHGTPEIINTDQGGQFTAEEFVKAVKAKGCRFSMKKLKPVLDAFKSWLLEKSAITVPKSTLGKAIAYTLDQWDRLARYMDDVIVTPGNNRAENAIRPFVLGRNPSWRKGQCRFLQLCRNGQGQQSRTRIIPEYIFTQLPCAKTDDDLKALLPQRYRYINFLLRVVT